ncbi:MAG TPA: carboxypeptidase regulatory-like domain-containing protein, partial [Rugosimonospora sp.]
MAGSVGAIATPAFADNAIGVSVLPLSDFGPGDTQNLQIEVQTKLPATADEQISVSVNGLGSNFAVSSPKGCDSNGPSACTVTFKAGSPPGSAQVSFTIKATSNVAPGQNLNSNGTVKIADFDRHSDSANFQAVVHGNAAAPTTQAAPTTVNQVSGTVKDIGTGAAISGASVAMQDDANHTFTATTDSSGRFTFRSSGNNPIVPGVLAFVITKDGYQEKDLSQNVVAGQSYTLPAIALTSNTPATASDSDPPVPTQTAPTGNVVPLGTNAAAANSGGSGFSTLLIVLGAILVLAGVAAIGIILWRRRNDSGEPGDDDDEDGMPRRGPTPVPSSRGAYRGAQNDATQVARSGGYGDPTMVGRDPMADAPTMMHRPVVDEYPDPYGAPDPATQPAGYGGAPYQGGDGYGYGNDPYAPGGYGEQDYDRGAGYDAGPGGYDATQPAHSAPGQRPAADPYAAPPNRDYGGYNEPTTYGRAEPPGGGYGATQPASGAGYGATQPASGGGYGATQPASGGGYGASRPASGGGYGAGEPTRRAGYGDGQATSRYEPEPEAGGYGAGGGYEPGGYEPGGYESSHRGSAGGYESGGAHGSADGYPDTTRRYEGGGGGYGGATGYEPPAGGRGGGTYGSGGQPGYDEPRGGYGSEGGAGYGGGYDDPRGGREQRGGH